MCPSQRQDLAVLARALLVFLFSAICLAGVARVRPATAADARVIEKLERRDATTSALWEATFVEGSTAVHMLARVKRKADPTSRTAGTPGGNEKWELHRFRKVAGPQGVAWKKTPLGTLSPFLPTLRVYSDKSSCSRFAVLPTGRGPVALHAMKSNLRMGFLRTSEYPFLIRS